VPKATDAGHVSVGYSQNRQNFQHVGTFEYTAPLTPNVVDLTFLEAGLIGGGALLLLLSLAACAACKHYLFLFMMMIIMRV